MSTPLGTGDAGDQQVRAGADQRDRAGQGGQVGDRQHHLPGRDVAGLLQLPCWPGSSIATIGVVFISADATPTGTANRRSA